MYVCEREGLYLVIENDPLCTESRVAVQYMESYSEDRLQFFQTPQNTKRPFGDLICAPKRSVARKVCTRAKGLRLMYVYKTIKRKRGHEFDFGLQPESRSLIVVGVFFSLEKCRLQVGRNLAFLTVHRLFLRFTSLISPLLIPTHHQVSETQCN